MPRQFSPRLMLSSATSLQRFARGAWWDRQLAIAVIVTIGVMLRIAVWVQNRSLWLDEIYLALNITSRSFTELWRPLAHDQGAPIGVLMLVKLVTMAFGDGEMALRVVPLFAGLASMFMFPKVAGRFLPASGVLFATALFAVTPKLIYYSSELKQYSTDVLVTLLILDMAARRFAMRPKQVPMVRLAMIGCIAVWFSHAAVFSLSGAGITLAIDAWRRTDRRELACLVAAGAMWLASLVLCYLLCLRQLGTNRYLLDYWAEYFAPMPPHNIEQAGWYLRAINGIFEGPAGMVVADVSLAVPAILMFALGLHWLGKRNLGAVLLLIVPLGMVFLASALQRYPFGGRLLLFAVPLLHIGLGAGWLALRSTYGSAASTFASLSAITVLLAPALTTVQNTVRPTIAEDNRAAIRYIADHWQPGDSLYLSSMATQPMAYYGKRFGIESLDIHGGAPRDNWSAGQASLQEVAGRARVWVLFAHERSANQKFTLWQLDQMGTRRGEYTVAGAAAYLYDLSVSN